jgi:hypothetical protein
MTARLLNMTSKHQASIKNKVASLLGFWDIFKKYLKDAMPFRFFCLFSSLFSLF